MDRTLRDFYGFERRPFRALDDAAQPFLSKFHADLVRSIVDGALRGSTITAVRGGQGVGKTTLIDIIASELRMRNIPVARIAAPQQNPIGVQQAMEEVIGVEGTELRIPDEFLRALPIDRGAGGMVLLLDDADGLSGTMWRYLMLLSESSSFAPLKIKLILFGKLGQWAGVEDPGLETLRHATLSNIVIPPLSTADAEAYLSHKLASAGRPLHRVMTRAATRELIEHAHGVPGRIDELADFALWHGYQIRRKRITRKNLRMALAPDRSSSDTLVERRAMRPFATAAATATILVAATTLAWWMRPSTSQEPPIATFVGPLSAPETHPAGATMTPTERPSASAENSPPKSETANANPSPPQRDLSAAATAAPPTAPVAANSLRAPEPDAAVALPETHPSGPTIAPAEPPSTPAGTLPAKSDIANASSSRAQLDDSGSANGEPPTAPVANSLREPEPDPAVALPETHPAGPTIAPAEGPATPAGNLPAAATLPAPEPDQIAALPEAHPVSPDVTPADPLSVPAPNVPSTTETANAGANATQSDPPNAIERIPAAVPPARSLGAPGLVLVAGTGDSLATLYAKMYRGLKAPPYAEFVAANRTPVAPGALIVFPEPAGGWSSH